MREIKFRAWDEQNKIMHYDFQFIKSGDEGNDYITFVSDKQPVDSEYFNNPYFSQQFKIMQYVGFNDKKGISIYEGDILIRYINSRGKLYRSTWKGNRIVVEFKNGRFNIHGEGEKPLERFEVIGNIYDKK